MKLIVDADPLVYRSGFAAEKINYAVTAEAEDGKLIEGYFSPLDGKSARDLAKEWAERNGLTILDWEKHQDVEPVEYALQAVKKSLQAMLNEAREKFGDEADFRIILSGPGNFREKLSTVREYKGNRDPEHKPVHYQAIRDYLTSVWNARVVHGREADDEVSILARRERASGEPYAIATIDKDLDQVPGWHYDYRQKVWYEVSDEDARRAFWIQALAGDTTDNIPGCWKVSVAKATKAVDSWLHDGLDDAAIWDRVLSEYEDSTARKGCPYASEDYEKVALETARLVYMQKHPCELWNPPGTDHGVLEDCDE